MSCIFCQIAAGRLPAYKVYEDDQFLAFLDIKPIVTGHTLVIPKKHYRWVHEVEIFSDYWEAAHRVATAQLKVLQAPTIIFGTAGFQVPHAHIHILPAPKPNSGEYLPVFESAKRMSVTGEKLSSLASAIHSAL